eukprot:SAG11_NODE_25146_length_363_cov_0.784091_1_plen_28_part_01
MQIEGATVKSMSRLEEAQLDENMFGSTE